MSIRIPILAIPELRSSTNRTWNTLGVLYAIDADPDRGLVSFPYPRLLPDQDPDLSSSYEIDDQFLRFDSFTKALDLAKHLIQETSQIKGVVVLKEPGPYDLSRIDIPAAGGLWSTSSLFIPGRAAFTDVLSKTVDVLVPENEESVEFGINQRDIDVSKELRSKVDVYGFQETHYLWEFLDRTVNGLQIHFGLSGRPVCELAFAVARLIFASGQIPPSTLILGNRNPEFGGSVQIGDGAVVKRLPRKWQPRRTTLNPTDSFAADPRDFEKFVLSSSQVTRDSSLTIEGNEERQDLLGRTKKRLKIKMTSVGTQASPLTRVLQDRFWI